MKVVVATSALGMGFDKPDLGFVVHYQSPGSPIAYYQQVGRAGRALDRSRSAILLRGHEDVDIQDYFIRTAFPPRDQAEARRSTLLAATARPGEAHRDRGGGQRPPHPHRGHAQGARGRRRGRARPTAAGRARAQPWTYDAGARRRVTAQRRAEQAAMRDYAATTDCRMAFLRDQLDDPRRESVRSLRQLHGAALGRRARSHRRRRRGPVPPLGARSTIEPAPSQRVRQGRSAVEPGRALSVYGDGGWGSQVARASTATVAFSDELVDAAARLVRGWRARPGPTWVTPGAVAPTSGARRRLRPPARRRARAARSSTPSSNVRPTRPQQEMENSAQQLPQRLRRVRGAPPSPSGPVLLVDDIVDSRWTLTVVGALLRQAGCRARPPLRRWPRR